MGKLCSMENTEMLWWVWIYRTCVYVCICPCMHVGELGIHHQMLSEQHIIKVFSSKTERHCSSVAICYFYFLLASLPGTCVGKQDFLLQRYSTGSLTAQQLQRWRILLLSKGTQPLFHKSLKHVCSISRRHH